MSAPATPWAVIASPTDPDMYAVQGVYLVADSLPIEDARLIAAAPEILAQLEWAETVLKCWIEGSAQLESVRAAIASAKP